MGDLLLLDQSLLEYILSLLDYKDLLSLRITCKGIEERINEFLRHFTSIMRLKCQESNVLNEIRHCWETELLEQLDNPNSDIVFYKYKDLLKDTFLRKSVCKADDFPHLGNPSYIKCITDPHLQRSIVHLSSVCFLHCSIHFENVEPGRYKPSVVLRLLHGSFTYPFGYHESTPDIFVQVKSLDNSDLYSEGRIPVKDIRKWVHKTERTQYHMLEDVPLCSSCHNEKNNGGDLWFYYHLPEFNLTQTKTLNFIFHDIQNKYWKNGIEWDFFQLRKIN